MKKLIALFIAAGGLAILPILHSYRQLNAYYTPYGIDIKQWVESDEWISLSLDTYVDYVKYLLLILGPIFILLKINSFAKGQTKRVKVRIKRNIKIFRYSIIAVFPWIVFGLFLNAGTIVTFNDIAMYLLSYAIFYLLIILREIFAQLVYKLPDKIILVVVFFWMLLIHPLLYAGHTKSIVSNSTVLYKTMDSVQEIDSLTYLGSSKKYFFLHSNIHHSVYILRKDSVEKIILQFQTAQMIIQ